MNKPNQFLIHSVDYDNAIWFANPVTVLIDGQAADRGNIVRHTENSVYINDGYYLKSNCTFTI